MAKRSSKHRRPTDEELLEEEEPSPVDHDRFIAQARQTGIAVAGDDQSFTVFVADPAKKGSVTALERQLYTVFSQTLDTFNLPAQSLRYDQLDSPPTLPGSRLAIQFACGDLQTVSAAGFAQRSRSYGHVEVRHPTIFRQAKADLGATVERIYVSQYGEPEVVHSNVFAQRVNSVLMQRDGPLVELLDWLQAVISIRHPAVRNHRSLDRRFQNPAIERFGHLVVAAPAAATEGASYTARLMNRQRA